MLCRSTIDIVEVDEAISVSSSDESICTVNQETGKITAGGNVGTCTITIIGVSSHETMTINVAVRKSVTYLTGDEVATIPVIAGFTNNIKFNLNNYEPLTLTPSNTSKYTVTQEGKLTGINNGTDLTLDVYGTVSKQTVQIPVTVSAPQQVTAATNCVGYYMDIEGDGIVDGVIFADLAFSVRYSIKQSKLG